MKQKKLNKYYNVYDGKYNKNHINMDIIPLILKNMMFYTNNI